MTEQEFNLLEIVAIFAAKLRARPAQIVCPEVLDSNLLRRLLDDRPNRPVAQFVRSTFALLERRPQQAAVLDLRLNHPGVDSMLDPDRNRHGADSPPLPRRSGKTHRPPASGQLTCHPIRGDTDRLDEVLAERTPQWSRSGSRKVEVR